MWYVYAMYEIAHTRWYDGAKLTVILQCVLVVCGEAYPPPTPQRYTLKQGCGCNRTFVQTSSGMQVSSALRGLARPARLVEE
jgi:hypothetical protein